MPSLLHEGLIDLFRSVPALAPALLREALHTPLPAFDAVRVGESNLTELVLSELRADLVLLLEQNDQAAGALIVEVQLGVSPDKHLAWPSYIVGLRSRLRCAVVLLVVTDDAAVARWAARPIETGHPGFVLSPLVLGPGSVPVVVDEAEARRRPEMAVLSTIVYGSGPEAVEIGKAALAGAHDLDDDRAALYTDLVLAFVNDAARTILEGLMASTGYQYQSDFAKRYVAQGRAEGQAEGRAEGRAEGSLAGLRAALQGVLGARKLTVTDAIRRRIEGCSNPAVLTSWLERAATANSEADVFAGSDAE